MRGSYLPFKERKNMGKEDLDLKFQFYHFLAMIISGHLLYLSKP
jgi:hypothetical protein